MPRARDLLMRFRPAGAPGAASAAGVPADRVAELARELQPVFDALVPTEAEVAGIRTSATEEARRRTSAAAAQARVIIAAAERQAEAERADAAARILRQVEAEGTAIRAAAESAAARIRDRAEERLPGIVAEVVEAVRRTAPESVGSTAP